MAAGGLRRGRIGSMSHSTAAGGPDDAGGTPSARECGSVSRGYAACYSPGIPRGSSRADVEPGHRVRRIAVAGGGRGRPGIRAAGDPARAARRFADRRGRRPRRGGLAIGVAPDAPVRGLPGRQHTRARAHRVPSPVRRTESVRRVPRERPEAGGDPRLPRGPRHAPERGGPGVDRPRHVQRSSAGLRLRRQPVRGAVGRDRERSRRRGSPASAI